MALALLALSVVIDWGGMAAILHFDGTRQREKARAAGGVDFLDRSVMPYMLLGILCGPLPLIFYFGTTRRSVGGWLLGLAIGVAWTVVASVVINVLTAAANRT